MVGNKRFSPKSKAYIKETLDIVNNTENDQDALEFLKDTLEDDFPELELGSMDLHEAIKVLGAEEKKSGGKQVIEDLNRSLTSFIDSQSKPKTKPKSKAKPKKRRKKKKATK